MTHADLPSETRALAAGLRRVAEQAARAAAPPLVAAFRGAMEIGYKTDLHDPVTAHDRRTEEMLRRRLLAEVPGSAFVGEEGGESGTGPVKWYVDPIDGTANFAAGMAFWCISIGAVQDDRILAGVVFDPVAGNLFAADLDGAWINGTPLRPQAPRDEGHAALITSFPRQRDIDLDGRAAVLADFGDLLGAFSTLRRPGSAALSLCHVAAGWTDAAFGLGINAWDVTAGILILHQSGGVCRGLTLGERPAGTPPHLCPGYVAYLAGGAFPTLDRVSDRIDARRRLHGRQTQ